MVRTCRLWLCALLAALPAVAVAKDYPLVSGGKAVSCIVVPDSGGPCLQHAAAELALFLGKVTGASVPVGGAPVRGLRPVTLSTASDLGANVPPAVRRAVGQLRDQGFVLAADDAGLRVIGAEPVAVLFGVYDLLKRYAGMRWFYPGPDGECCRRRAAISVPAQVAVHNPSFRYREISFVCANVNSRTVDTWDWMVRNGIPVHVMKHVYPQVQAELEKRGGHTDDGGHCFAYLLSDKLFDEHPEYFGLYDGERRRQEYRRQPCTSNPAVARLMATGIEQVLDTAPGGGRYLIGNNDATDWCQCEPCTRQDPPEEKAAGRISTRYCTFVNAVAGRVWASHPQADLWAWAYQNYQLPPSGVTLDKRLGLEACTHHRCYRHSLDDERCPANAKFRDMLSGWCRLGHRVTAREYNEVFPGDPPYIPFERLYYRDLQYYHKLGMAGFRLPIAPPDGTFGPTWDRRSVKEAWLAQWQGLYLAAVVGWDVTADLDAVLEDLGSHYYGVAWKAMKPYRELLTRIYEQTPGDIIYGAGDLGTCLEWPNGRAQLEGYLAQAEQLAAGDALLLRRITRDRDYLTSAWVGAHEKYLATRPRETYAARRQGAVTIDGKLDEPAWQAAAFTSNFATVGGQPADPQTGVRVLYDAGALYFAVEALEPRPAQLQAANTERDGAAIWKDSTVEFFVVLPGAGGRYLQLAVTPRGTLYDALNASATSADLAFDAHAEVKTAVLADRWVVEARLPAAALGRPLRDGETWKVNVGRNRQLRNGEPSQASSWSNGAFHGTDAYRPLVCGSKPLLLNGDFEDTVAAPKVEGWEFAAGLAPAKWSYTQKGIAAVLTGEAASGRRYYRGTGWLFQFLALPAEFRGALQVRAKARGTGSIWLATFQYQRTPHKFLQTVVMKEARVDGREWTLVEGTQAATDDRRLALALHLDGAVEVDDVVVTAEAAPGG